MTNDPLLEMPTADLYLQTYSGGQFHYEPDGVREISIIDISISLAGIPRFLRQSRGFLSVAEHCLAVSGTIEAEGGSDRLQLLGLLHDCEEAYIGDWPSPLVAFLQRKYAVDLKAFKRDIRLSILKALDIEPPTPAEQEEIARVDMLALAAERALFMPSSLPWHIDHLDVPDYVTAQYAHLDSDQARMFFERAYYRLSGSVDFERRVPA